MTKVLILTLVMLIGAVAASVAQDRPELRASRTAEPPRIDGVLDDDAWKPPSLSLGDWRSYNPIRGDLIPADFRTEVRIVYDDRNVYFAFHCFDTDPGRIRATVSRRDNAFSDDWIALSLDSAATGQTAYHLFINPLGMQMDAANTPASGEQFDADFVWYSVGKVTDDGYVVEVQVPLQSLRFAGGSDVPMGILFFRKISRIGVSYSWPDMPAGQWVFERHARLHFSDLSQPRLVELLPSVTYGVNQGRVTTSQWGHADRKGDVGLSGKFGITSNITLDGTINPDFSQVESDAFQVEVNQRFPIFYSEKRPFFMEGMGLFNIAGTGGDGNMRTAVHTRRVADPFWGTKVTGTAGRTTFGVLNTSDDRPVEARSRVGDDASVDKLYTIARATYALRGSDYLGAILTDTEHAGRYNRVVGADMSLRFTPPQQLTATVLATSTGGNVAQPTSGNGAQVTYAYFTRRFGWENQAEHYDRGFQMDTAFYNRTGFTAGWSFGEVNFYPGPGGNFGIQRVHPFYFFKGGRDEVQDGNEAFLNAGIRFNFTRQGFVETALSRGSEAWRGEQFDTGRDLSLRGNAQILRWLHVGGRFSQGPAIFYDDINPFQGRSRSTGFDVTVQPNAHLSQSVEVNGERFERESSGERIFSVNIVNLRTVYQFDKHLLVRLLEQFDSSTKRLLTDLLASYEFVPGTVVHGGYGSLYEKRGERSGAIAEPGLGDTYLTVSRGLFFKASYLRRF